MAFSNEDGEDSLSNPMSLRCLPPLPPPLPPISACPYTHQVYIPEIYQEPTTYPDDLKDTKPPYQDQYTIDPIYTNDYRSHTMDHSHERPPQALPSQNTPLPGISNFLAYSHHPHSDSPDSPMQLGFILNGSEEPSPPTPSSSRQTTITWSTESPSLKPTLSQKSATEAEAEADTTSSSPPPPLPEPQSQRQNKVSNTRASTARQTITRFEAITAHTAKCDLCNRRNDAGMSRCLACGWQSCHSCTLRNGCTRTHKAGSRAHSGPIDSRELVKTSTTGSDTAEFETGTSSRGRKSRARGRGRGRGKGTSTSRMDRERETETERVGEASPVADVDSNQRPDLTVAEGAKDLFAFVLQALIEWAQEQKGKGREEPGSGWGLFADIEDAHSFAQEIANKAYEQYSQNE